MIEQDIAETKELVAENNRLLEELLRRFGGDQPELGAPGSLAELKLDPAQKVAEPDTPPEKEYTREDVVEALQVHQTVIDRDAVVAIIAQFVPKGEQPVLSNVPTEKYADVIAACAQDQKAA